MIYSYYCDVFLRKLLATNPKSQVSVITANEQHRLDTGGNKKRKGTAQGVSVVHFTNKDEHAVGGSKKKIKKKYIFFARVRRCRRETRKKKENEEREEKRIKTGKPVSEIGHLRWASGIETCPRCP